MGLLDAIGQSLRDTYAAQRAAQQAVTRAEMLRALGHVAPAPPQPVTLGSIAAGVAASVKAGAAAHADAQDNAHRDHMAQVLGFYRGKIAGGAGGGGGQSAIPVVVPLGDQLGVVGSLSHHTAERPVNDPIISWAHNLIGNILRDQHKTDEAIADTGESFAHHDFEALIMGNHIMASMTPPRSSRSVTLD